MTDTAEAQYVPSSQALCALGVHGTEEPTNATLSTYDPELGCFRIVRRVFVCTLCHRDVVRDVTGETHL